MISKAKSCPGGTALFQYVVNEKKGYELLRNGLSGITPKELYTDMAIIQKQNLRCQNNTISMVLSPAKKEGNVMTNDQLKVITKSLLKKMDLDPRTHQYIAFVHTETSCKHIHILLNRVKTNGKLINDHQISVKAQTAAHKVAVEHGWISGKDVKESNERKCKRIEKIIRAAHYKVLKERPKNLKEYQINMAKFGIQVIPSVNRQGNIQGYRFLHEPTETNLKASQVSRKLNLNKLFAKEKINQSNELQRESLLDKYSKNTSSEKNKEPLTSEYKIDPIVFSSIFIQSFSGNEESPEENFKQKKKRKQQTYER